MYEPQNTDEHLEGLNKVMMEWYKNDHFDNIPNDILPDLVDTLAGIIQNEENNQFYLLRVIEDIREKTGIGDKVMLADLADTLAGLIQNGESAIETNKQLVKRLQQMKGV
ncbi:MAG: hypothetical protein ACK5Q7_16980 [Cyanobacteriota bacterium]